MYVCMYIIYYVYKKNCNPENWESDLPQIAVVDFSQKGLMETLVTQCISVLFCHFYLRLLFAILNTPTIMALPSCFFGSICGMLIVCE